jgi:hypothetical protein
LDVWWATPPHCKTSCHQTVQADGRFLGDHSVVGQRITRAATAVLVAHENAARNEIVNVTKRRILRGFGDERPFRFMDESREIEAVVKWYLMVK